MLAYALFRPWRVAPTFIDKNTKTQRGHLSVSTSDVMDFLAGNFVPVKLVRIALRGPQTMLPVAPPKEEASVCYG